VSSIGAAPVVYATPGDYTVNNDTGEILRVPGGTIPLGATVSAGYKVANYAPTLTAVNAAIAALGEAEGTAGVAAKPNVIVVPNYDSMPAAGGVKSSTQQMIDTGRQLKARVYVDSPATANTATVKSDRSALTGVLGTTDIRVTLCHPRVVANGKEEPLSLNLAGITAKTDKEIGYWRSPDNQPLVGVSGIAPGQKMSTSFVGGADNQDLNRMGFYTVCAIPGEGLRGWGLWNSSYPSNAEITQYIPIIALQDYLEQKLTLAALPFLGNERGESTIAAIKERLLFTLNSEESLMPGNRVEYVPSASTTTRLAYKISVIPKLPIENITMTLTLMVPLAA
jgi:phage tail sheath protein FI